VALDFDNFPALNDTIQNAIALVCQLGSAHNHVRKNTYFSEFSKSIPNASWGSFASLDQPDVHLAHPAGIVMYEARIDIHRWSQGVRFRSLGAQAPK
jgi:hypothetical protein